MSRILATCIFMTRTSLVTIKYNVGAWGWGGAYELDAYDCHKEKVIKSVG